MLMPYDYYDLHDPAKGSLRVLWLVGRPLQTRELNEQQRILDDRIAALGDALLAPGTVISGAAVSVNASTGVVTLGGGKIYVPGLVVAVPAGAITVPIAGTITVGIRYAEYVVTEQDDASLRGQIVGTDGYMEPGAARLRYAVTWGWDGNGASDGGTGRLTPVYTVVNGVLKTTLTSPVISTADLQAAINQLSGQVAAFRDRGLGTGLRVNGASIEVDMAAVQADIVIPTVRTRLTADTVFYCSPAGSDTTGNGTAAAPFRQPQRAYAYLAANIDPAGYTPKIKLADGTYDSVSLGPIDGLAVSNTVNELNSTLPILEGNTGNPSAVVIDGTTNTVHGIGVLGRPLSAWRVIGCTFKGATYGVAAMGGVLHLQNCRYDAAPWALLAAIDRGELYLGDGGRIVAGSSAAFLASGGGMIYGGTIAQTWYVDNNPEFTKAFLVTLNGCSQDIAAITFSGSARGKRHYTENNCLVYVGGKYAPGDQSGSTGSFSSVS